MEHEAVVVSLRSSEALRVHHELERFNPLRGGNTGTGGRDSPHSETGRDHSGGNGKQGDLAHLSSPVQSAQDGGSSHLTGSNMPGRALAAVMAITKWSIPFPERASVPATGS